MDLDRPKPSLAAGARKCEETEMGTLRSEQWIEVLHRGAENTEKMAKT